jgi:hypothetical protein
MLARWRRPIDENGRHVLGDLGGEHSFDNLTLCVDVAAAGCGFNEAI